MSPLLLLGVLPAAAAVVGFAPEGLAVGDSLYIDKDDFKIKKAGEKEDIPLGVVTAIDTARTPDAVMVNTEAWQWFTRPTA